MMRFDLTDEEWELLEPMLPSRRKSARVDDRRILNAIFYVLRTGMLWRDLPERYGPCTTAYNRFNRWPRRGIWKRMFDTLAAKSRDSLHLIDSTVVMALGDRRKRGKKSGDRHRPTRAQRKFHANVDGKGRPLNFTLTDAQVHDSQAVEAVLDTPRPALAVSGDKGYVARNARQQIKGRGSLTVIPSRENATTKAYCPTRIYRHRHKIENFFCRIKDWRRIAIRYDKLARNFLAATHLVAALYWVRL